MLDVHARHRRSRWERRVDGGGASIPNHGGRQPADDGASKRAACTPDEEVGERFDQCPLLGNELAIGVEGLDTTVLGAGGGVQQPDREPPHLPSELGCAENSALLWRVRVDRAIGTGRGFGLGRDE